MSICEEYNSIFEKEGQINLRLLILKISKDVPDAIIIALSVECFICIKNLKPLKIPIL